MNDGVYEKKVFELLTLAAASPAHCRHGRQKVSIPEYDLTGKPLLKRACQVALRDVGSQQRS